MTSFVWRSIIVVFNKHHWMKKEEKSTLQIKHCKQNTSHWTLQIENANWTLNTERCTLHTSHYTLNAVSALVEQISGTRHSCKRANHEALVQDLTGYIFTKIEVFLAVKFHIWLNRYNCFFHVCSLLVFQLQFSVLDYTDFKTFIDNATFFNTG